MAKTFEVLYQAAGAGTGKTVQYDVFDETKTLVPGESGTANEIGTTGRYYKAVNMLNPGWTVEISDDAGGKAVKHIDQDKWDAHGVGGGINTVISAVADVQTAVDNANTAIGDVNTLLGTVDGKADSMITALADLGLAIDVLDDKLDNLQAPPMVG